MKKLDQIFLSFVLSFLFSTILTLSVLDLLKIEIWQFHILMFGLVFLPLLISILIRKKTY